ncbi:MAG: 1-deoxy-D-xylulose-5-phosphate reductoisomerase [Peptococcaceae bacterium]|jgi:1-deoxy-D-xylulose-5-phosphate reductoisomerase|nr:1-deoxy-D-xylulose-5-phosphate reductoisomerase [Peptococcaceae bacterium]
MAKQTVAILGSTGSIGRQTLEVVKHLGLTVEALTGYNNMALLARQVSETEPRLAVTSTAQKAMELKKLLQEEGSWMPEIMYGAEGFRLAATMGSAGMIVAAMSGVAGLDPVLAAVKAGKRIALANKEVMVVAGQLVCALAEAHGSAIFPVDSEHSAIFQCLNGRTLTVAGTAKGAAAETARQTGVTIRRLILTASGGPFRGFTKEALATVEIEQALRHPNWEMGKKITVDSATLMNKGLEVIEARWLFQVPSSRIQVVVHPQSAVHSMVEFVDGSILAQMGQADMRQPIQMALTWPRRLKTCGRYLDLIALGQMTFEEPDHENFPCLRLAYDALRTGGTMPALLNGANEGAVAGFLAGKIGFRDIPKRIAAAMEAHQVVEKPKLSDLLAAGEEGMSRVLGK